MFKLNPFTKKLDYVNDDAVAALDGRVTILENNDYKITYYEIITGTSGSITLPNGATISEGDFGTSGNSILSEINLSNKPTYQSPVDVLGNPVTANLATNGTWTSGTYTSASVALIYSIIIKGLDLSNLNTFYIIESEELDDWTLGFPTYDTRYAQIGTDGENFEPVESILNIPPAHVLGERYLIGTTPTGAWVGYANYIAESDGVSTWTFTAPILDYRVFVNATLITYKYSGSAWLASTATPLLNGGNSLGVVISAGTNDNRDFILKRNNQPIIRFYSTGAQLNLSPTATTASPNNNSTRIATTAYVDNAVNTIDATADNFLLGGM